MKRHLLFKLPNKAMEGSWRRICNARCWRTGAPRGEPLTHTQWENAVAMGAVDGEPVIVSGDNDGTVRVWNARTGAPVRSVGLGVSRSSAAAACWTGRFRVGKRGALAGEGERAVGAQLTQTGENVTG